MLLSFSEIAAVESTLAGCDQGARGETVLTLARRLTNPQSGLTAIERSLYDEVVCWLSRDQDVLCRKALALQMAEMGHGPDWTIRNLAGDEAFEVAGPVLRRSPLLTDEDLIEVARTRSQEHLCEIAQRPKVSEPVTDVVAIRGHWPVLRALAANQTARLSRRSLDRLVSASQGDGQITVSLMKRKDMPHERSSSLLRQIQALILGNRMSQKGEDSAICLDGLMQFPAHFEPIAPTGLLPRPGDDLAVAEIRVEALGRAGALTEHDVLWCLDQGRWTDALVVIARLAVLDPEWTVRGFRLGNQEDSLIIMRAANLSWSTAERVLRFRAGGTDKDQRIARNEPAYRQLSRGEARRALERARFRSRLQVLDGNTVR